MSWTRASDGRVITDAMLDAAIARDRAAQERRMQNAGIKARVRELRRERNFAPSASPLRCQRWNQTAAFKHCCDRFYAQIDYNIRMWEWERDLKLGVRQVVAEEERRKRERREMRAKIRENLIRRGVL